LFFAISALPKLSRHRPAWIVSVVAVAGVVGWCGTSQGASGNDYTSTGYGLRMNVDIRWVDGSAYRPVRISVSPFKPPKNSRGRPNEKSDPTVVIAARTLEIEFLVRRGHRYAPDLIVSDHIEIPAGATQDDTFEITVAVPQHVEWQSFSVNVREDGQLLQPRRPIPGRPQGPCISWTSCSTSGIEYREIVPTMLMVDRKPNLQELARAMPEAQDFWMQYNNGRQPGNLLNFVARSPGELPRRWIDYSSIDVVCLSLAQLDRLQKEHTAAYQAILDWTNGGGNLWVYGIGDDRRRLGDLEDLAGLSPGSADNTVETSQRGWKEPAPSGYGRRVKSPSVDDSGPYGYGLVAQDMPSEPDTSPPPSKTPDRSHFVFREYGMGLIVAFSADDPFPGNSHDWGWVFNAMGRDRPYWYKRHGVSMRQQNLDYWNFLIPDVGLAPVIEFCVLITLFVLAIGPLNYWLLLRWGRLHLLVVTIPVSAAAVTFVLFAYALVADGLGTRVRVRSVTSLDQRRSQAACWARLSYYSGLTPGRGMTFPDDVAVLPLEYFPLTRYDNRSQRREMAWEDGEQRLTSGWLSSRTPIQYLTVRSRSSDLGLDLIHPADGSAVPRIRNRLESPIQQLLICPAEGELYWADGVEPGATVALETIEEKEARNRLAKTFQQNIPRRAPGIDDQNFGGPLGISGRMAWMMRNRQYDLPRQKTGRMEKSLAVLNAHNSSRARPLAPGTYIAVVEQSPEVVLGVRRAKEEASYHVIFGRW